MKHGSGKYIYARHGEVISGTWVEGKLVGRASLKCSKFSSFEGKWDSEGPIGDGKFKLPKVSQLGGYTREIRKSKRKYWKYQLKFPRTLLQRKRREDFSRRRFSHLAG
jgi:hypothetical protein